MTRRLARAAALVAAPLMVAASTLSGGCAAGVTHRQIKHTPVPLDLPADDKAVREARRANAAADTGNGLRYYRSSPYVLVYTDTQGGIFWELHYLPDQTRKMAVDPFAFVAKLDSVLTFQDGMLSGVTQAGDATEAPKAILSAIQQAAPALAALAFDPTKPGEGWGEIPAPVLYKVVVRGGRVKFLGASGGVRPVVFVNEVEEEEAPKQDANAGKKDGKTGGDGKAGDAGKKDGKAAPEAGKGDATGGKPDPTTGKSDPAAGKGGGNPAGNK